MAKGPWTSPKSHLQITVNAIAPALISTDMNADLPKAKPDLIPVGRLGTVEEVAQVIVMLACDGHITGQTINVNQEPKSPDVACRTFDEGNHLV